MNYIEMLRTLAPTTNLPPPGYWLSDVERSAHSVSPWGMAYDDPRLAFDDTNCHTCGTAIGPYPDECEGQYGTVPCEGWVDCCGWMDRLYCEDCAEDVDPHPVPWFTLTLDQAAKERHWI